MASSNMFVQPEEKSTGYKFKHVYDEHAGCHISKPVQTTFQFIPISKTLTSLFSDSVFEDTYMTYNRNKEHICRERIYHNFCCGTIFKTSEFFKRNPLAIQIRLFTDDFEPCDPLKSKVGLHKTTAYYFQINNLPTNLLSKTGNIYLVALSDASDSKNELSDVNIVIETIVADIRSLESKGIVTGNKHVLKGTLTTVQFDNLGGNILFGFSGGFNANYYCRICTTKRQDCQQMVKEDSSTLRTIDEYDEVLLKIQSGENLSLTAAMGVKSKCILNQLETFHVLRNASVDLMHDLFEGTVGFLLEQVFIYCDTHEILSIDKIQTLIECFFFGELSKSDKPSKVILEKKNLGQNASQARCLILNLPFILHGFKEKLKPIWLSVETLLQIIQILLSDEIDEQDLSRLSALTTSHLECYQVYFNKQLKPKHHFMLHYEKVIKSMGPVIRFWAMRMEAKHQFFKQIVYKTKNFVNIKKTLADKHQKHFYASPSVLFDYIVKGSGVPFTECDDFGTFYEKIKTMKFSSDSIQESSVIKSLKVNDRQYKKGLLVASSNQFFEIHYILSIDNNILFLCEKVYEIKGYESFLNSMKLQCIEKMSVIDLKSLKNNKSYEKKSIQENIYLIADSLSIFKMKTD